MGTSVCPWWDGPCLFEVLDAIQVPFRDPNGPFRMPIISKSKDVGTFVMGKIESGTIREGDDMLIMPNKAQVKILALYCNEDKVSLAGPGENLRVRLSGIEDEGVSFVLCSVERPLPVVSEFVALLQILDLPDYGIFCAGFTATLYMNAVEEDCMIVELIDQIDTKTRKAMGKKPVFGKKGMRVECRAKVSKPICLEKFTDFDRLGRFTLRSNEITVAAGMVTELASTSSAAAA